MAASRCIILGLALACCAACSLAYTDDMGRRHVTGFVHMTIAPANASTTFAGQALDMTTLGVAIRLAPENGGLSVGYTRDRAVMLENNALVVGNPLQELEHATQTPKEDEP